MAFIFRLFERIRRWFQFASGPSVPDLSVPQSIEEKREAYLRKKDWAAPEFMKLFIQSVPKGEQRPFFMNPEQRIQACILNLKKMGVREDTIAQVIDAAGRVRSLNRIWSYEYIEARFRRYMKFMDRDQKWKEIEEEYQTKLRSSGNK